MKKAKKVKYVDYMPKGVPKDQRWFWTEAWQKEEREVDEEIRQGKYKTFHSVEEALKYLHSREKRKTVKSAAVSSAHLSDRAKNKRRKQCH